MVGRRTLSAFGDGHARNKKDANPYKPKPVAVRFQDASNKALEDERRNQLKRKLIDSVKADHLEKYRKSEDEVRHPSFNPGLMTFHELVMLIQVSDQTIEKSRAAEVL